MIGSLYAGASGVKAYASAMTVVGSNIANVNTVGYKYSRASFQDMLASDLAGADSKIGKGVILGSVDTIHTQGTFENSELETDLAIDGQGFFTVKDEFGRQFYTRAGQFNFDRDGFLTNTGGLRLQVKDVDSTTGESSGELKPINIMNIVDRPKQTGDGVIKDTGIKIAANLDSNSQPPDVAFNPANVSNSAYNFSTAVTVYDQLGDKHTVTVAFRKSPDIPQQIDPATGQPLAGTGIKNAWEWYALLPGEDIEGGRPKIMQAVGGGMLQFSTDGRLINDLQGQYAMVAPPPGSPPGTPSTQQMVFQPKSANAPRSQVNFQFKGTGITQTVGFDFGAGYNPTDPLDTRTGLEGITQFAGSNKVLNIIADGNKAGTLERIAIDSTGIIEGTFDSGTQKSLGRIILSKFAAKEKLEKRGDNLYMETVKSGQALLNDPGKVGLGTIRSKTLEKANVDLATEFVKMIETQRAFQANAKTVTASDEMVTDLVQMKR